MATPKANTKTVGLLGVLLLFVAGVAVYSSIGSTKQYDETKTHAADNISTLKIRVPNVDVQVVPTDGNQISAHFSGRGESNDYTLSMTEIDRGLQVIVDHPGRHWLPNFHFGGEQLTLEVQVPKREYSLFTVDSSSGDIQIGTLVAKHLQITTGSGDIELPHFQGDELLASASSGDVTIGDVQAAVDLHTNSGDIEAKGIKGKLNAGSSSGEIRLSQIEGDTTLSTSSGDVKLAGLVASHLKTTTSSGEQELTQISGAEIDAESSSGDITIGVQDKMANLKLHSSSGDAKVALPADAAFALNFNTSSGSADIGFPITYSSQDKHSMHGTVGTGGSLLDIHTSSGNLTLGHN